MAGGGAATGSAFLSGLFNVVGPHIEDKYNERLKLANQKKEFEFKTYMDSMQDLARKLNDYKAKANPTPEETKQAFDWANQFNYNQQQLGKLTKGDPALQQTFQKVGGFVKKILSRPSTRGQFQPPQSSAQAGQPSQPTPGGPKSAGPLTPPGSSTAGPSAASPVPLGTKNVQPTPPGGPLTPPPQASTPAQGAPQAQSGSQPTPAPAAASQAQPPPPQAPAPKQDLGPAQEPSFAAAMASADPQRQKEEAEDREYQKWLQRGRDVLGPDASARDLAQYAGSKGQHLPPQSKPVVEKGIEREGYPGAWNHTVNPDGSESWSKVAEKPQSTVPRVIGQISVIDAKGESKKGKKFKDEDGNEIDVDELPAGMELKEVVQGSRVFYVPASQNQTHISIGGKWYAVGTLNQQLLPQGEGTELGPSKTRTDRTHTQITFDPNGNPILTTLPGSSTPETPGIPGRPSQPSAATPAPAPAQAAPAQGAAPAKGSAAQPAPSSAPASTPKGAPVSKGASQPKVGIPSGSYNQALQRLTPVREAATQLFGDPSQPELKGLIGFANLADNKESRERIGKALQLTFNALDQVTGGASVAVGAGPVSVSAGGFGTWLQNALHIPGGIAEQQVGIMQRAIEGLSPEEKEAYDATMSGFSTIIGLRSLTKASAAQASVRAIEREMPIIGVNTANSNQFYDQMQRLAEVVYNGTLGVPTGMWDPSMIQRIKNLPKEIKKFKKPSPKGTLTPPSKAPVRYVDSDGKQYDIPADQQDAFKKKHPKAKQIDKAA